MSNNNSSVKSKLILVLVLIFLLLLAGVAYFIFTTKPATITPSAQTSGGSFTLSPATRTVNVNDTFDVNVLVNTNSQNSIGAEIRLTYNPADLEIQDADTATSGVQITPGPSSVYGGDIIQNINTTAGTIEYSRFMVLGGTEYNGSGTLATIRFKALREVASSPVSIVFTSGQTNDSNIATRTYPYDILTSVTNGTYTILGTTTINLTFGLEARPSNAASTNTIFRVYPTGSSWTTNPLQEKTDITTAAAGTATFTFNGQVAGNYDYRTKVRYFLSKKLTGAWANPLNVNFGTLRGGDSDNNNVVNTMDFSNMKTNWGTTNAANDFNLDGRVNMPDFAVITNNLGVSGE